MKLSKLKPKHAYLGLIITMLLSGLSILPIAKTQEVNTGNITFQPNAIPDVNVYYDDYSFVFEYKSFFIRVRPFVIYDEQFYGMKQIVTWIKNNYPNVNYKWLVDKAVNAIHYGFNLTKLPQNVADKIDYLGFRLVDLNFPLSWFKLEEIEVFDEEGVYNITRIHIPKANLVFSFEDLYPQGYSIQHINSTYILIGGVRSKVDLIIDPITFSGGIMTMTDFGSEGSYADDLFWEFWNASYSNNWNVSERTDSGENTQFTFGCRLKIGNGTEAGACFIYDTEVQVFFNSTAISANNQFLIEITRYSDVRLGILLDATNKLSYKGVQIIAGFTQWGIALVYSYRDTLLEVYSCHFINTYRVGIRDLRVYNRYATMKVYNTILDGCKLEPLDGGLGGSNDIYDVEVKNCYFGVDRPLGSTIDRILLYNNDYHLYFYTIYVADVSNLIGRNAGTKSLYMRDISVDPHLINCEFDSWDFYWLGASTAEIYRQYEFVANITDGNAPLQNANVTIYDNRYDNGTWYTVGSWLTWANGTFPLQALTKEYFNQSGGNVPFSHEPINITVTLSGYQTHSQNITLDEAMDYPIALQETTAAVTYTSAILVASLFLLIPIVAVIFVWRYGK